MSAATDNSRPAVSKKALLLCVVAVLLPWLWGVWAVPVWVAVVSLVFSLVSLFILSRLLAAKQENLPLAPVVPAAGRDQAAAVPAEALTSVIGHWVDASQIATSRIDQARSSLEEVTKQSESAAVKVGNSFRVIMDKTGQQMDSAVRLLKSNAKDGTGGSTWLSLPDFIKAYENQLDAVTSRMMDFSKASEDMSKHQDIVREHSITIDEMLDELRTMAARIRKLALDSTVAFNRESNTDMRWFIEIADRIRETSTLAHELTRRMRDGLEKIREVMASTYDELSKSSDNVKLAAVQAKVDVSQLNIATMEKAREVTKTLEGVNELGQEIRQDINRIIIAMQYQDITQQKLEHIKAPLLQAARASLGQAMVKTQSAGLTASASPSAQAESKPLAGPAEGGVKSVDVELF